MNQPAISARLLLAAAAPKDVPEWFEPDSTSPKPTLTTAYQEVAIVRGTMKSAVKGASQATSQTTLLQYRMMHEQAQQDYRTKVGLLTVETGKTSEVLEESFRSFEEQLDEWHGRYQLQRSAQWALHWADQVLRYDSAPQ